MRIDVQRFRRVVDALTARLPRRANALSWACICWDRGRLATFDGKTCAYRIATAPFDIGRGVLVPPKLLKSALSSITEEADIMLGKDSLDVTARGVTTRIPVLSSDEFPTLPDIPTVEVSLPGRIVASLLDSVRFAAGNTIRYRNDAVALEVTPGVLRAIATDGKRMAVASATHSAAINDSRLFLLPTAILNPLMPQCRRSQTVGLAGGARLDDHTLAQEEKAAFFLDDITVVFDSVKAKDFAPYPTLLESDKPYSIILERDVLLQLAQTISEDDCLSLIIKDGRLEAQTRETVFSTMLDSASAPNTKIAIDGTLLAQGLTRMEGRTVILRYDASPVGFITIEAPNYIYMLAQRAIR